MHDTDDSIVKGMYEIKIKVWKIGKVVLIHGMKTYRGKGDTQPLVRNVDNGWNSAPVILLPGKVSLDALNSGLGGPHSLSGSFWEETSHLHLERFELQIVTTPHTLSRVPEFKNSTEIKLTRVFAIALAGDLHLVTAEALGQSVGMSIWNWRYSQWPRTRIFNK